MKKIGFLSILLFLLARESSAHTISQHLEEIYIDTYFFFFIFSKHLLFIGLGLATPQTSPLQKFTPRFFFPVLVLIGILPGYFYDGIETVFLINKIGIIVTGVLMLVQFHKSGIMNYILSLFGFSIGFEYGQYLNHTHGLEWFYILLLISGTIIFLWLNKISLADSRIKEVIRVLCGFVLVLSGIIVVLLT